MAEKKSAERVLKVLHEDAAKAAAEVVKAMNDRKSQREIKALKKACSEKVNTYNLHKADEFYRTCAKNHGENAVKFALSLENIKIPGMIGYTFAYAADDTAVIRDTTPYVKVDLTRMQKAIGKQYFHDPDWFNRVNVLARLMAIALNNKLCGVESFQYIVDEAASEFELPEETDATSEASLVQAFQRVIDGILWIDQDGKNSLHFDVKDLTYVHECMSRQGAGTVEVVYASPVKMAELVACSINRMLTNRGITLKCDEMTAHASESESAEKAEADADAGEETATEEE